MLSFLYRLIRGFRSDYGFAPNVVYLSSRHYDALRANLSDMTHEQIEQFLQLHIILEREALHPHVAWEDPARWHQAAG